VVRPRRRQRLGLLAFAFDGAGRRLLDTLADRPDLGDALVVCHHAVAETGEAEPSTLSEWLRRSPGTEWQPPSWSGNLARLEDGFDAAMRDALDNRRWLRPEGGVDQVDLLLIAPTAPIELPKKTLEAVRTLRRFRLLGRVMLLAQAAFQTVGQTGVQAKLSPLPFSGAGAQPDDDGLFDLVLLIDYVNLEGRVFNDEEETAAYAASALVQLTVGETHATLYERLQAEAARLPAGGRYVSIGVSEWRLEAERVAAASGDLLYRRMAGLLARQPAADADGPEDGSSAPGRSETAEESAGQTSWPPEPNTVGPSSEARSTPATRTHAEGDGGDPWIRDLASRIEAITPQSLEAELEGLAVLGTYSLAGLLAKRRWSLAHLAPLLARRCRAARAVRHRSSTDLALFMRLFAPWYAHRRSGLRQPASGETGVRQVEVLDLARASLFGGLLLVALGSAGTAWLTEYEWIFGVVAAGAVLAAAYVAVSGLSRTETSVDTPAPPLPRDLMADLEAARARMSAASTVVRWCEQTEERFEAAFEGFRRAAEAMPAREPTFPETTEVCSALLAARSLTEEGCLRSFWAKRNQEVVEALTRGGDGLPAQLEQFAANRCRAIREIRWHDVVEALGSPDGSAAPQWAKALEQARDSAVPRMPVPGHSSYNLLALPRELPATLREALVERFPEQAIPVEAEGDAVVVVRVTQGYEDAKAESAQPSGRARMRTGR